MFKKHKLKKAFKRRYGKAGKKYYKAFMQFHKVRKKYVKK
jgi:hypothetical protein